MEWRELRREQEASRWGQGVQTSLLRRSWERRGCGVREGTFFFYEDFRAFVFASGNDPGGATGKGDGRSKTDKRKCSGMGSRGRPYRR